RDAPAVPRQQGCLDHRPGENEVEEPVHMREAGQVHSMPRPPGLNREQQRGEDDDRRHQLRAPEGLLHGASAERPDHAEVGGEHQPASPASPASASSGSRWCPVLATNTSSRLGSTRSSASTVSPASSSARTTGATALAPPSSSTRTAPSLLGSGLPNRATIA